MRVSVLKANKCKMVSMPLGIKTILQLWNFFWKEEWYLLNSIIDQIDKNDFLNKRGWGFSQGNGLFINRRPWTKSWQNTTEWHWDMNEVLYAIHKPKAIVFELIQCRTWLHLLIRFLLIKLSKISFWYTCGTILLVIVYLEQFIEW